MLITKDHGDKEYYSSENRKSWEEESKFASWNTMELSILLEVFPGCLK